MVCTETISISRNAHALSQPRKLADRGIVDPLANLFSTNIGTSAPAPVGAESVKDIQVNTQASTTSIARSTTTVEQDSQSQSRFLRPDSKYSKLKRRVGQGSSSQLPGQSMLDQVEEEEAVPSKRFKSFDPNIESVTSQAAARLKEKEAKEKMAHLHSDGGEDVKAIASERRVAEIGSDSDQDSSAKATQSKSRKKAGQADNEGKPNAKQTRTDDRPSAKESVYLQIKTGRRKIGKADADINEDFNNLRIKKTQAPESHKMGWNERDVFQEEMTEDAAWEAEDKSTFFQVRFVPMARPKSSVRSQALSVDPLYTGRPNFKAFKPKALVASTSTAAGQRKKRADIALVAYEAPSYGLQESYGDRGPRQNNGDDSDTSIEMPMPDLENTRKGKGRAKATASSRATKSAKGKRAVVSDSSEEDELEGQESSTAREESAPAVKK